MRLRILGMTRAIGRHNKLVRSYKCQVLWPNSATGEDPPPAEVQIVDASVDGVFPGKDVGDEIEVS